MAQPSSPSMELDNAAESKAEQLASAKPQGAQVKTVLLMLCVILTACANNFSGRIKAKLLGEYNVATVIPDSIVYLAFNVACLAVQLCTGQATRAQIRHVCRCGANWASVGSWKFLAIAGISDIMCNVTGLAAQPHLTTLINSLMDQATTPFTVLFSLLLLGARYTALEVGSICFVFLAAGAAVVVASKGGEEEDNSVGWCIFAGLTTSFAAVAFVLKELTFREYESFRKQPKSDSQGVPGAQLPLVHTTGDIRDVGEDSREPESVSVFLVATVVGVIGVLVCVPLALLNMWLLHPALPPWQTLEDGLRFLAQDEEARNAYLIYVCFNVAFNLSLLLLTSSNSAVLTFLSMKLAVPLTAILSPVKWPVIGAKHVGFGMWVVLALMIGGISVFRWGNFQRDERERSGLRICCWPFCGSDLRE